MKKLWMHKSFSNDCSQGFSLLEIAVVLAVLSLLSSIAIPNILKIGKDSNLSEAQALVNSAAADCLQSLRNGEKMNQITPDPNTISDVKLESINYKIKASNKNCSNFQIEPFKDGQSIAGKDPFYYTFGFRFEIDKFENDKLVKVATDQAVDNRNSCKRWAGNKCGFDPKEEAKWIKYYEHLSLLQQSKDSCLLTAQNKLKGPPAHTGMYETWDPTGESECKKDPPNIPTNGKCEINSCNKKSFAKDGQPLSGEDALKAALCADWLNEIKANQFTTPFPPFNPTKDPQGNCPGDPDFWFINGVDQITEGDFKKKLCEDWIQEQKDSTYTNKPTDEPMTYLPCGDKEYWFYKGEDQGSHQNLLSAQCKDEIEQLRASGWNGIWSKEGPIACSQKTYICNKSIMEESKFYQTCGKSPPQKCKEKLGYFDQDCADYERNEYKMMVCGPRPPMVPNYKEYGYSDPYPCGGVGRGAPTSKGWDKTKICADWAKKCDLYK